MQSCKLHVTRVTAAFLGYITGCASFEKSGLYSLGLGSLSSAEQKGYVDIEQ